MKQQTPAAEGFLSRWSRRKREAVVETASASVPGAVAAPSPTPIDTTERTVPAAPVSAPAARADDAPLLPPIATLTIDSDYSAFFQPRVPDALRRAAVKKLFADPHFNVMDGLDTYIDDYSKPDPLPDGWLAKLNHARDLIDHPSSRKAEAEAGDKATNVDATNVNATNVNATNVNAKNVNAKNVDVTNVDVTNVGWVERSETHQPPNPNPMSPPSETTAPSERPRPDDG